MFCEASHSCILLALVEAFVGEQDLFEHYSRKSALVNLELVFQPLLVVEVHVVMIICCLLV